METFYTFFVTVGMVAGFHLEAANEDIILKLYCLCCKWVYPVRGKGTTTMSRAKRRERGSTEVRFGISVVQVLRHENSSSVPTTNESVSFKLYRQLIL